MLPMFDAPHLLAVAPRQNGAPGLCSEIVICPQAVAFLLTIIVQYSRVMFQFSFDAGGHGCRVGAGFRDDDLEFPLSGHSQAERIGERRYRGFRMAAWRAEQEHFP